MTDEEFLIQLTLTSGSTLRSLEDHPRPRQFTRRRRWELMADVTPLSWRGRDAAMRVWAVHHHHQPDGPSVIEAAVQLVQQGGSPSVLDQLTGANERNITDRLVRLGRLLAAQGIPLDYLKLFKDARFFGARVKDQWLNYSAVYGKGPTS